MKKKLIGLFVLICVLIGASRKYNLLSMSDSESDKQKVKEYYERLKAAQEDPKAQEQLRERLEKASDLVRRSIKQPGRCPLSKEFIDFLLAGGPITLRGHERTVNSVAFSPDGNKKATVEDGYTVKIWNVNTGQLLQTLVGHKDTVRPVVFSPDGNKIATGSGDGTAKLWDVNTGQLLQTLQVLNTIVSPNIVWSVAFSPDGSKLATGSFGRNVKLWNVSTGQLLQTLVGHTGMVRSVAFSPDGSKLATGSVDNSAKLWDVNTGQLLHTLAGHTDTVYSVAFNTEGSKVVTESADKTAKLWDVNRLNEIARVRKEEIKEKEIRETGKNLTKEPTISLQRFLKVLPDKECEKDPEYCKIMSIEQCELLQAFQELFHKERLGKQPIEIIKATLAQWQTFKSLPDILQEILKNSIKAPGEYVIRKHHRRNLQKKNIVPIRSAIPQIESELEDESESETGLNDVD